MSTNKTKNNVEYHTVDILRPFGPRILKGKVPSRMLKALNAHCDSITKSSKKRKELDASGSLVGHVSEELDCSMDAPELSEFYRYLGDLTKCLLNETLKEATGATEANLLPSNVDFDVFGAWFVRSFKGDYNPIHVHSSGDFSCVLYLKVPDSIGVNNYRNVKELHTTEGYIDFSFGLTTTVCSGNQVFMPIVGDIYIFPAYLSHTVYPFFGKGERRSFSANFQISSPESKAYFKNQSIAGKL